MDYEDKADLLKLLLCIQASLLSLYVSWSLQKSNKWINRRWLVRPINSRRLSLGHFRVLFTELRQDPDMFFRYTRMTVPAFDHVNEILMPYLTKKRTDIQSAQRLLITLRYLAVGDSILSLALDYRFGESTCREIITETCNVIFQRLSPKYLNLPSEDEWKAISKGFLQEWNLPNCCGAIDGKHIRIRAPPLSGSVYYNHKKFFSIVLLAVCNHAYEFTLFDVGALGSESDGGIFTRSELGKAMKNNTLNMPAETENLPGSDISVPYYFAGDSAFELASNLMRPYTGRFLPEKKLIFNYRLSRARRIIENTFGILTARWQFLLKTIAFSPAVVNKLVLASICLHNFLMRSAPEFRDLYCPEAYVDKENSDGSIQDGHWRSETNDAVHDLNSINFSQDVLNAHSMRDTLADYFLTPEGMVPWQWDYVRRGLLRDVD